MVVSFTQTEVIVEDYDYPPSLCYPRRVLSAGEIMEVSTGLPPTMRLRCRDVLFVPKPVEADALGHARRNGIPIVDRYDPWSFVLEPFLDTSYTAADHARVVRMLQLNGISDKQCKQWRRRFKSAMFSYNFDSMLWEWCHLGAMDLLDAHMGKFANPKFKLPDAEFAELYRLVIQVLLDAALKPSK